MNRRKNTTNGKYYLICNPRSVNEHTGNFCIDEKYILAYDRDFLFDWINPENGHHETKVISKEYVMHHIKKVPILKEDKYELRKTFHGYFWIITYKDIKKY